MMVLYLSNNNIYQTNSEQKNINSRRREFSLYHLPLLPLTFTMFDFLLRGKKIYCCLRQLKAHRGLAHHPWVHFHPTHSSALISDPVTWHSPSQHQLVCSFHLRAATADVQGTEHPLPAVRLGHQFPYPEEIKAGTHI